MLKSSDDRGRGVVNVINADGDLITSLHRYKHTFHWTSWTKNYPLSKNSDVPNRSQNLTIETSIERLLTIFMIARYLQNIF